MERADHPPLVLTGPIERWQQRKVKQCGLCPFWIAFRCLYVDITSMPDRAPPDWCPLRLGPVVVSLAPSEEE